MEDTYRFWGQKVKGQGHSDMPPAGPSLTVSVF